MQIVCKLQNELNIFLLVSQQHSYLKSDLFVISKVKQQHQSHSVVCE